MTQMFTEDPVILKATLTARRIDTQREMADARLRDDEPRVLAFSKSLKAIDAALEAVNLKLRAEAEEADAE